MTGSHEVEGSIPFGSTRSVLHRALFLLLVGAVASLGLTAGAAEASGWLGGDPVDAVPVQISTVDSGSIGAGYPGSATGWWVPSGGDVSALSAALHAGMSPALELGAGPLLAFALGERPTGGYAVAFGAARLEGDRLIVEVEVTEPEPGGMLMQVITCPYAVASLALPDGSTVAAVEFRDAATGKVLAKAS